MLNVNEKRLYAGIIWYDYVKDMQNLKKYAINFSHWVEIQVVEFEDRVLRRWNIDKWVKLFGVSKQIDLLVIKLNDIEYKEDLFYYLSS